MFVYIENIRIIKKALGNKVPQSFRCIPVLYCTRHPIRDRKIKLAQTIIKAEKVSMYLRWPSA